MMMINKETRAEVGRVIWSQISVACKMACGARKAVVSEDSCWFQVGSSRPLKKIVVKYEEGSDLYTVSLVKLVLKKGTSETLEEYEGVYCDQLSTTIYSMVNK